MEFSRSKTPKEYKTWNMIKNKALRSEGKFILGDFEDLQIFGNWFINKISQLNQTQNISYRVSPDLYQWDFPYKVYSTQTCTLLPLEINDALSRSQYDRGNAPLPPGIAFEGLNYSANITLSKKRISIGCFDNPIDAFLAYKITKEAGLRELADRYFSIGAISEFDRNCLYNLQISSNVYTNEINQAIANGRIEIVKQAISAVPIRPLIFDNSYGKYFGTIWRHNRSGSLMQVIAFRAMKDVDVLFLDSTNYIAEHVNMDNVIAGNIRNPYHVSKLKEK